MKLFYLLFFGLLALSANAQQKEAPGFSQPFREGGIDLYQCDSSCIKENLKFQIVGISGPHGSGTGTIIGKKDNIYTLLTSRHVINKQNVSEYEVMSYITRKYYPISMVEYPLGNAVDIAVVRFKADENLNINLINIFNDYYPLINAGGGPKNSWGTIGARARSAGISMPSDAIKFPIYRFQAFELMDRIEGNLDGYEFIYTASTVPGMSGGPIVGWRGICNPRKLSAQGPNQGFYSLLAIHGRSEGYTNGGRSGISMAVPVDLIRGYLESKSSSYGIPTNAGSIEKVAAQQYCAN